MLNTPLSGTKPVHLRPCTPLLLPLCQLIVSPLPRTLAQKPHRRLHDPPQHPPAFSSPYPRRWSGKENIVQPTPTPKPLMSTSPDCLAWRCCPIG
ncbi:hypothetical protein GDO81_006129 [Engystomops pustulosus]|uniref:Secreted protein n=1 Tax=Engystomops pustulosus TaxID=76066 RepID=A0AAV7CUQ6_ENGPU|nr:hypothetical protein GDO81_006129 [Engystomops pustulosus]